MTDHQSTDDQTTDQQSRDHQRHGERYGTTDLAGSLNFSANGTISDISLSGMSVETDGPLLVGQNYNFSLGENQLPMAGLVKWCVLNRTEKREGGEVASVYRAGLAFGGLLSDEQSSLQQFISEIVKLEVERRIFGRFSLEGDHSIQLISDGTFEVEKLSVSGMLIKTEFAVPTNTEFPVEVDLDGNTFSSLVRVRNLREEPPASTEAGAARHHLGVQFVEHDETTANVVQEYLEQQFKRVDGDESS